MSDDPRYFPPYSLIEVTDVTVQNRYLLRPSAAFNDRFLGVLGRAQRKYGMTANGLTVLSSHYHLVISVSDQRISEFFEAFNGRLSKAVNVLRRARRGCCP